MEGMGQYEKGCLLICTISQLVTMVMNEGGWKHAVINTNSFSGQSLWRIISTHTLCKHDRSMQALV